MQYNIMIQFFNDLQQVRGLLCLLFKSDRHDRDVILLTMALDTITITQIAKTVSHRLKYLMICKSDDKTFAGTLT